MIQLVHRSMVLVGSLLVVAFLVSVWRKKGTDPVERNLSLCAIALLAAQIVVGALSALYSSHSEFADVHLALASALWGAVVAVFALSARERPVGEPNPLLGDHFPSDPPVSHVLR